MGEKLFAQAISAHGCKKQLQRGTNGGADQRVFIADPDVRLLITLE